MRSLSCFVLFCVLLHSFCSINQAQGQGKVATKTIIHFCDQRTSCGYRGTCEQRRTGNRCKCSKGWMGRECKRPCQDVYKSCDRWEEEKRCVWSKPISPWFTDNCAATCQDCQVDPNNALDAPLAPILEPLSWLVGEWVANSRDGNRFPLPLSGPYREVLQIRVASVPMFDRPPLNFTVTATPSRGGSQPHIEVGFVTSKPFAEDTGFVEFNKPAEGDDMVAFEMNSNSGLSTIEEGTMRGEELRLKSTFTHAYYGMEGRVFKEATRVFKTRGSNQLEENGRMTLADGRTVTWDKYYHRAEDYLRA